MTFTAIDLSKLPPPSVIEELDAEAILKEIVDDFVARDPAYTALLESDPAMKLCEAFAYREMLLRARINAAARAVLVPLATGADLDNLAALIPLARDEGESDARFRARVQLAPEAFSTAGPEGGYLFHALGASARVKDAAVNSPAPGEVVVTVLAAEGDGTAVARESVAAHATTLVGDSVVLDGKAITALVVQDGGQSVTYTADVDYVFDAATSTVTRLDGGAIAANAQLSVAFERAGPLGLVELALGDEDVRPLTDQVTVQSATIVPYSVAGTVTIAPGPPTATIRAAAVAALDAYIADRHALGAVVAVSGLHRALHVEGVISVSLSDPAADIAPAADTAAYCSDTSALVFEVAS